MHPRRKQEHLVLETVDDELLVYDELRHQAHALNATSALIWQHCDGVHSPEDLARILKSRFDTEHAGELARLALQSLRRAGLLEEPAGAAWYGRRISRRDLARKLGTTGKLAALVPVVTSIVAPTAAQAATCIASSGCVAMVDTCKPCGPPNCIRKCDSAGQCSNATAGC